MVYAVKDTSGNQVNIIEIMPEQVASYEAVTGLTLELFVPEKGEVKQQPDVDEMEAALNELGVTTREDD